MIRKTVLILFILVSILVPAAQAQTICDLTNQEDFVTRAYDSLNREDYEAALSDYQCALQINPANSDALFGRAYSQYNLKQYTEAEADYTHYLESVPTSGDAYNNRGNIYYAQGDYDRARADYDKAISLPYEEKFFPYYNRGLLSYELGDYVAAVTDLSEAIDLNSLDSLAYLARALAYNAQGNEASLTDIAEWVDLIRQQTVNLAASDTASGITLSMSKGVVFEIPLSVQKDAVIRVAASTTAEALVDPLVLLIDHSGKVVAWDDDSGVNLNAVLRYTVQTAGDYKLLLTHAGGGSEGDVLLKLILSGGSANTGNTTATETPEELVVDETFQVFDLAVNTQATVFASNGDHLNLRSGPGLTFDILSKLEPDANVTLLEGPRKQDGYNWWRVSTNDGQVGWAVERVEEEQTLYPSLKMGGQAAVTSTEGDTLRVREGAGRSFSIVTQLPGGTVVTLLEGPQIVDDLSWWKIRTSDGIEGWAVESASDERTLVSYSEASG